MKTEARKHALLAMLQQRCPRCRSGAIFRSSLLVWFPQMHQQCPACGLKFEREEGYFLGAMYISYALGVAAIAGLGFVLWWSTRWPLLKVTLWAVLIFLPLAPPITFFSRVLWIYLDQALDPEPHL